MTKGKLCPRCGTPMQRLYVKKKKQLKGFGWLCWKCTTDKARAYVILDEDCCRNVSRWSEGVYWIPRLRGYRKAVRRTVYLRTRDGWEACGSLLLPYGDVVLHREPRARKVLTEAITKFAAVSAFSFRCECGRTYVFDVLREEMRIHASEGKPKPRVDTWIYSLYVECPECHTNNEYVVYGIMGSVKIACNKCKLEGVLDINMREAHWYPRTRQNLRSCYFQH